jgi:rhamnogalacturonyl hydrolase YesR
MAKAITSVINGQQAMQADDLIAVQQSSGLWHVYLADCGDTLTVNATEEQARRILSEA